MFGRYRTGSEITNDLGLYSLVLILRCIGTPL